MNWIVNGHTVFIKDLELLTTSHGVDPQMEYPVYFHFHPFILLSLVYSDRVNSAHWRRPCDAVESSRNLVKCLSLTEAQMSCEMTDMSSFSYCVRKLWASIKISWACSAKSFVVNRESYCLILRILLETTQRTHSACSHLLLHISS